MANKSIFTRFYLPASLSAFKGKSPIHHCGVLPLQDKNTALPTPAKSIEKERRSTMRYKGFSYLFCGYIPVDKRVKRQIRRPKPGNHIRMHPIVRVLR